MKRFILAISMVMVACGSGDHNHYHKEKNDDVEKLKSQVLALIGTIDQIENFTASDFSTCSGSLPPFETKICQIAQTATAEQSVLFASQLQEFVKVMQTSLYGADCRETVEAGCPAPGSVLHTLDAIETAVNDTVAGVADMQADITALQADVAALQASVASLNSRLNDFNGSGESIETVVSGIETTIAAMESRIDAIEDTLDSGSLYKTALVCGDIVASGPIYEAFLITGDDTQVIGYIQIQPSNQRRGLGVVAAAGDGDVFTSTHLNTQSCNFKIYDLTTTVKLRWNNSNRNSSQANIDTACDSANNFASPKANCTCAN